MIRSSHDESVVGQSSAAVSRIQSFELCEDPSFWKDYNVQVIIRMRPLSNNEISVQGNNKCVRQESCQTISWTGPLEAPFTFDMVADENVSQENLFKVAGVLMVDNCKREVDTMLGDIEGGTRRHIVNCGMTPRIFEHLVSRIQKECWVLASTFRVVVVRIGFIIRRKLAGCYTRRRMRGFGELTAM
ncbi:kinesin-like protein KIN-12E isoform X2 [Vicia villosa]|uniref:kinesin-like protein KIN-12E isoform X2 n=1 Tax=Vicia villosa TaxID=3911 RepID=UPI00273A7DED|nr:kinesin-like protein KIN-12E isoform X2 [Vicia villosa]